LNVKKPVVCFGRDGRRDIGAARRGIGTACN
jgi:hypothetical protein